MTEQAKPRVIWLRRFKLIADDVWQHVSKLQLMHKEQDVNYEYAEFVEASALDELRRENERLVELAWRLDDHTIHARNKCDGLGKCTCGLDAARAELKALKQSAGE